MIHYASFGRRTWGLLLTIFVDLVVLGTMEVVTDGGEVLAPFGFWLLLHHVGLVVEGGTVGHRLAGLRVVREDGGRIGVLHAIVRALSAVALSLPPLGLGFLWMLDQPRRQTWHDLLGNSVVVREVTVAELASPDWANDPPWLRTKDEGDDGQPVPAGPVSPILSPNSPPAPDEPRPGPDARSDD